ncbi:MAG: GntR family transcriptional regulator [Paenibacillus sp.]|nr:GntR family transcriptional regulator [Paenibacillus sp.]
MTEEATRKSAQLKLQHMVDTIRQHIISGLFKQGQFLPSEKAIAKEYGLSNVTVREGLDILVSERLIEKIPRIGNRVVQPEQYGIEVIRFAYYKSMIMEAALDRLIASFHRKYPNLRVHLMPINCNDPKKMMSMMDDGEVDVFSINHHGFLQYDEMNGTDYMEPLDFDDEMYPFLKPAFTKDKQLKAKPFLFSPLVLCYNLQHFQEQNLLEPDSGWDWERLFEYANRLTVEQKRLGFYCHFLSLNRWPVIFLQSGKTFERDEYGKIAVQDTPLMDGLRACKQFVEQLNRNPVVLSEKEKDAEELFFDGKVSMIMTSYLRLNHYVEQMQFPFELAPLPYLHEAATLLQVIGLSVYGRSKVKQSARCLVDYLTSYEAQLMIRQHTLSLPSLKRAAEWKGEELSFRPSRFFLYRDIIPTYRTIDYLKLDQQELDRFRDEAKLYWSGLESEQDIGKRLEAIFERPAVYH